jgi:hypothetical protein
MSSPPSPSIFFSMSIEPFSIHHCWISSAIDLSTQIMQLLAQATDHQGFRAWMVNLTGGGNQRYNLECFIIIIRWIIYRDRELVPPS